MLSNRLNAIFAAEMTAVKQFLTHSTMLANEGNHALAQCVRRKSEEAGIHAAVLRNLGADALPDETRIGRGVKSMLENDLALQQDLVPQLTAAIRASTNATRQLLEVILVAEERHLDWLEAQLHLIAELGEEEYCASQRTA